MKKRDKPIILSPHIDSCDFSPGEFKAGPFTMVIFGGAGDLSKKKLIPSLYHLYQHGLISDFSILGFARTEMSDKDYRSLMMKAIKEFSAESYNEKECKEFCSHLFYEPAKLTGQGMYATLCDRIGEISGEVREDNLIYYLAVPPDMVPGIIGKLSSINLCRGRKGAKVVVEKPFGRDRKSAAALNRCILKDFNEKQIYRMDHYLGKETVQSILFFRFSNTIFEPLWNRNYIDNVQITVAEDIGIENRGAFYDKAGVIRDIVQNHIMQLIALVAMEPPVGFEADLIRDEKVKIFETIRPADEKDINANTVIGQYGPGKINGKKVCSYQGEKNVAKGSSAPTYFAGKFYIDNWRWADVPFYVRTGKRLPKRVSEISIEFKHPPLKLLEKSGGNMEPNTLVFNIQPHQEISLRFNVKCPGAASHPCPVGMLFNYEKAFDFRSNPSYERQLLDCMKGDLTLFARQDGVENMWSVVDPIIRKYEESAAAKVPVYSAGTWGPEEAKDLIERDGRKWRIE
ncbi:glucose-6-phosphate dehydrogenase [Candidatus Auribacterota bacterium]